ILAPRHVERVDEVHKLVEKHKLNCQRLSQLGKGKKKGGKAADWDVLLVDKYGVLVDMYRFADVVIMGGTFNPKVGGHNIHEATALGKTVVVGPHTYGITSQMEMLRRENAVLETDTEHAAARLAGLYNDIDKRLETG